MGCRTLKESRDQQPTGSPLWKVLNEQYEQCVQMEAMTAIMDALERLLLRRSLMKYVLCRLGGGTLEDCHGVPPEATDLLPPPPGPELDEWLGDLSPTERVAARGFLRDLLVARAKEYEAVP